MDSDKVLVMNSGEIVEFDHPYNLLKNKEGFLYKMVKETGQATSYMLHSVAAEVIVKIKLFSRNKLTFIRLFTFVDIFLEL